MRPGCGQDGFGEEAKCDFSAFLDSVDAADPELFDTKRETSRESLNARLLKGLEGNLF